MKYMQDNGRVKMGISRERDVLTNGVLAGTHELVLVLLPEAVANGVEVPAAPLVHFPHVRLLARVLRVRFVDQMHQEEPVFLYKSHKY